MRVEKISLTVLLAFTFLAAPLSLQAAEKTKPAPGNSAHADQETNLAAQAYQSGDYTAAAAHFKQVLKLDPGNVKAWLFLGQSSAKLNDNMGARRAFAKVLALQASGPVADRAIEQLSKLPEPDLFALQLDSGLTLGDWLPMAEQQVSQGKRESVLKEIAQYLHQLGPVPQLLTLQDKLQKEVQADQEQKLNTAIKTLKVSDADTAKTALAQIRNLRQQAPNSLQLIQLEARACHYLQNFACAEKSYATWIKTASSNDPKRKSMVAALMQAKQHETLQPADPLGLVAIPGENYAIGAYEVTQKLWTEVMGSNPSKFTACGEDCPVEQVSWNDIQDFLKKINAKTGKQYRLPTEAEWEYACRGGKMPSGGAQRDSASIGTLRAVAAPQAAVATAAGDAEEYCGGNDIEAVAWYSANSGNTTHQIGQKQANAFGLYDMSGNVWEWVQDKWSDKWRVVRGGSWVDISPLYVRAAHRDGSDPAERSEGLGFRLARTLP